MESVVKHIPIADARWIGDRLGQLSADQISDCFRASGFSRADVEEYSRVVVQRIAALKTLDPQSRDPSVDSHADATVPAATDKDAERCLESTCRQAPIRETLTAIKLNTTYARAIVGGFEQKAGIGGGVQLTSANAIPALEFRATALTSTLLYRRFDLEAFFPNIGGSRNHADVWVSYQQRETDFFGIGPCPADLKTRFAIATPELSGFAVSRPCGSRPRRRLCAGHVCAYLPRQGHDRHTDRREFLEHARSDACAGFPVSFQTQQILSYGGFLAYDTRDNSIGLTRGVYIYGRVASADALGPHDALADYRWIEQEIDVQGHAPLGSPRTSLCCVLEDSSRLQRRGEPDSLLRPLMAGRTGVPSRLRFLSLSRQQRVAALDRTATDGVFDHRYPRRRCVRLRGYRPGLG